MSRLRTLLTNRKYWLVVLASLSVISVVVYLRQGTVVVRADAAYMVEIFSGTPKAGRNPLLGLFDSDARPEFLAWGTDVKLSENYCVFCAEINGERPIRLRPGTYVVAAHRKSPCGYYGGSVYQKIEVPASGRVECAIPSH